MLLNDSKKDEVFEHLQEIFETLSDRSFKEGWICDFDLEERKATVFALNNNREFKMQELELCSHFKIKEDLIRAESELVISEEGKLLDAIIISQAPELYIYNANVPVKNKKESFFLRNIKHTFKEAKEESLFMPDPVFSEGGIVGFVDDFLIARGNFSLTPFSEEETQEDEDIDNILF